MSKEIKNKIVPRLRFHEFRDSGAWEEKMLKSVCKMQAGKFVSASEISEIKNDALFPCFGGNGLRGHTKSFTHIGRYSLIGRQGALCGNVTLADGKFHATEHAVVATPENGVDRIWLFYMLTHMNLNQYATGQAQPGLSVDNLEKLQIIISSIEKEQQKIADCLSSLDELITAQNQQLEALKAHKKGLMQQLFPAEGETVPQLRFEEFKDSGEWEEDALGNLVEKVGSGTTPLGGEANYFKSGRPFVRSQNVGWGVFLLDDIVFINEHLHQNSLSTEIKIEDVLLNITGASIGRSAVVDSRVEGGNVNQHVCIIRANKERLSSFFLNQYLISASGQKQIDGFQAGGNRQGLNFAQIRSFLIPIPTTINEQQK